MNSLRFDRVALSEKEQEARKNEGLGKYVFDVWLDRLDVKYMGVQIVTVRKDADNGWTSMEVMEFTEDSMPIRLIRIATDADVPIRVTLHDHPEFCLRATIFVNAPR